MSEAKERFNGTVGTVDFGHTNVVLDENDLGLRHAQFLLGSAPSLPAKGVAGVMGYTRSLRQGDRISGELDISRYPHMADLLTQLVLGEGIGAQRNANKVPFLVAIQPI